METNLACACLFPATTLSVRLSDKTAWPPSALHVRMAVESTSRFLNGLDPQSVEWTDFYSSAYPTIYKATYV